MTVSIIQDGDVVLRKISKDIPISNISKPKIQKIISDMNEALDSQWDGVAIAAPQIGFSLRLFIVSGKVFDDDFIRGTKSTKATKHPNLVS